ncbi:MAG: hypothetical protein ABJA66_18880 [Actinomycetota bacterium]
MSNQFKPVGNIERVEGNCFSFTRKYPHRTGTFRGVEGMTVYENDIIETDMNTTVSVLFFLGGRANIDHGSKVEIIDERNALVLKMDSRTLLEQFKREKSPIKISTAGGVMAIRG